MGQARVLFVSHTGAISGAERVLLDVVAGVKPSAAFVFEDGALAAQLRQGGADVFVSQQGVRLSQMKRDSSFLAALPLMGRLLRLIAELAKACRAYDLIYANSQKAFTLSAIAAVLAGRPLIWHLHDILSPAHFGSSQRRMQVVLANLAAQAVIVPSRAAADAFVEAGGRKALVQIVANGVAMRLDARSKADLRNDLHLPAGSLVGVFSRLARWKGQEIAIRALAQVPEAKLLIAGSPLFGEQAYADMLQRLVDSLGLADRVLFLGQRDDVPVLMQAIDVMVHPSIEAEPFGLTLIEAMRARVAVIASDAGASADILDNGRFGTLVPPADVAAQATALNRILSDPESVQGQLDAAQVRAQTVYSIDKMQQTISELIFRLMSAHPVRVRRR